MPSFWYTAETPVGEESLDLSVTSLSSGQAAASPHPPENRREGQIQLSPALVSIAPMASA